MGFWGNMGRQIKRSTGGEPLAKIGFAALKGAAWGGAIGGAWEGLNGGSIFEGAKSGAIKGAIGAAGYDAFKHAGGFHGLENAFKNSKAVAAGGINAGKATEMATSATANATEQAARATVKATRTAAVAPLLALPAPAVAPHRTPLAPGSRLLPTTDGLSLFPSPYQPEVRLPPMPHRPIKVPEPTTGVINI